MYSDLKGKAALVTGGATGMGKAVALALAAEGVSVAVTTGRNVEGAQETVRLIEQAGGKAVYLPCDVRDEAQVAAAVQKTAETFGSLDLAFNNAGVGPDGVRLGFFPLTELSLADYDKIMDTNLKGVFLCLKHELRLMRAQKRGAIVNTASIGGLKMAPGFGAYGPSKAGVIAFTKMAALENADLGIRVNAVCPGPTDGTELMKNSMATAAPGDDTNSPAKVIPMGRLGTTRDICKAVLFLLSDEASFTTGEAFSVSGGMAAR